MQVRLAGQQVFFLPGGKSWQVKKGVRDCTCVSDGGGVPLGMESDTPYTTLRQLVAVIDSGQWH